MDSYITILENEIKTQTYLLENYIGRKQWVKAGGQQEYINGLAQALHLAMAVFAKNEKHDEIKRRIDPQPKIPIVSIFHGSEEYEDCDNWCYQHPETNGPMTYNVPNEFTDPDQPGKIGELYDGKIIKRVRVKIKDKTAYWVIDLGDK